MQRQGVGGAAGGGGLCPGGEWGGSHAWQQRPHTAAPRLQPNHNSSLPAPQDKVQLGNACTQTLMVQSE